MPGWTLLTVAIVSEVCGTLALKVADGFRRPGFMVVVVLCYGASFAMLALALKSIQVGPAYAIWSGVGTAMVVVAGAVLFGERLSWVAVGGVVLIVAGVVVLTLLADVSAQ
ncbi:MAG TPA: multidrug efflux SMR transporter [Pseudonocardiaceae bacterium]